MGDTGCLIIIKNVVNKLKERFDIMKRAFLLFAFLSLVLSCNSPSDVFNDSNLEVIETTVGENFNVELEANRTTGYQWFWINKDSITVADTTDLKYIVDDPDFEGSPGTEMWIFKAMSKGDEILAFEYRRFENEAEQTKKIRVVVK